MAWRLALSLEVLRAEVNEWAPNRSKASDGTLGDPAHASRPSRHNPNDRGVVCALDITHDPSNGCDVHALARRLARSPHPDLTYIISDAQVAKRSTGFRWESYTGPNKHRQHAHFAVGVGPDSEPAPPYDSSTSWAVSAPTPAPAPTPLPSEENDMPIFITTTGDGTWYLFDGFRKRAVGPGENQTLVDLGLVAPGADGKPTVRRIDPTYLRSIPNA